MIHQHYSNGVHGLQKQRALYKIMIPNLITMRVVADDGFVWQYDTLMLFISGHIVTRKRVAITYSGQHVTASFFFLSPKCTSCSPKSVIYMSPKWYSPNRFRPSGIAQLLLPKWDSPKRHRATYSNPWFGSRRWRYVKSLRAVGVKALGTLFGWLL